MTSTFRTSVGKIIPSAALAPFVDKHPHHLGDNVTGPLDNDRIALSDILTPDLILVMQRRTGHDDTTYGHGSQFCNWGQRPRATNLNPNIL